MRIPLRSKRVETTKEKGVHAHSEDDESVGRRWFHVVKRGYEGGTQMEVSDCLILRISQPNDGLHSLV